MGLLARLHRLGVNAALLAGLMLMPAVIAVGYLTDGGGDGLPALVLRGTLDGAGGAGPGQ